VRICLVYDCLYPHTIGGAERWYRQLARRLVAAGHDVTYLTMRQWDRGTDVSFDGVRVVALAPRLGLYAGSGRRRIGPPIAFGAAVAVHLLRHGDRYDVVHSCSFPYFPLLAAAIARRRHRFRLGVDWFEVWTREYWREYLGRAGALGAAVQRLCARVPQQPFCFSHLHARRLEALGVRTPPMILAGLYEGEEADPGGEPQAASRAAQGPHVVFAGRQIPEKRVPALVDALALARERIPELRATIFGDGPEHGEVLRRIAARGLDGSVEAPGFVESDRVEAALAAASCQVLPSLREGYGLVVIEAAALGTPSVVVAAPDNAAVELVAEGENGTVAASATPQDLAAAIERVIDAGQPLRDRTAAWFRSNAKALSASSSAAKVARVYGSAREAG
jgi:glycosyltransferase involved in cell wall biosynthesis